MRFVIRGRVFKSAPGSLSIPQVWSIDDSELSSVGRASRDLLAGHSDADNLSDLATSVAWSSQAILEFQDLQMMPIPQSGRFFNLPFMFCQGLEALRESVIVGLNGQVHASLSVLRSAVELICFHYWWRRTLFFEPSYESFYEWLLAGNKSPRVSDVIKELYSQPGRPDGCMTQDQFRELYGKLCSYAHKPILEEAITVLRGGNQADSNPAVVAYWLRLLQLTQRGILETALCETPHALFPLPLERKFGFSPPVGLFFDRANFLPLQRALGVDTAESYRAFYRDMDPPGSQLLWFESLPDRSDRDIMDSWTGEALDDRGRTFEACVSSRFSLLKMELRALMWRSAYGRESPSIDDLAWAFSQRGERTV